MPYVPGFANDIFISYSHIDDQSVEGPGWVSDFHQRLQIEIEEELGARVQIWRDRRIGPADDFGRDLDRQVRASAVLLAILSPGYLNSPWCEWELGGFAGARRVGDLWVDTKCRVIKILKRPADVSPHRLRLLAETGFLEFFHTDQASGRSYEMTGGSEPFNRLMADLGSEIGIVLRAMRKARSVFLGTASAPLLDQRARVRQELEARAYRVLTTTAESADDTRGIVRAAVNDSSLSILFDSRTDRALENPAEALATDERRVAIEEGARQIVVLRGQPDEASQSWRDLATTDEDARVEWLFDPPIHTLYHTVLQMLGTPLEPGGRPQRLVRVYLICDRQDHPLLLSNRARNLRDHLLRLGFEVKVPLAEGDDAAEFSRDNRNKLRQCDGVLLYWGTARQSWFDQRLGELMQARGWRHGRAFVAVGAFVAEPANQVKQNYETREVDELIKQFAAFDLTDARLMRFVERLARPA
jgi:TIR domain